LVTGRCGNVGTAIAFVSEKNRNVLRELYDTLKETQQTLDPWFEALVKGQGGWGPAPRKPMSRGGGGGGGGFQPRSAYGARDARVKDGGGGSYGSGGGSYNVGAGAGRGGRDSSSWGPQPSPTSPARPGGGNSGSRSNDAW